MTASWNLVSKHRAKLMFLSILWVMVFHFTPPHLTFFNIFQSIGCGGVDMFMFLSGFGLCYSYYNRDSIPLLSFYKRRFIKIIPLYLVCIIIFGVIRGVSLSDILWQLSCIGFWLGKPSYDWYVPSILLLYVAFPFFVKLSKRCGIGGCVISASVIGMLPTALFIFLGKGTWILFTARIPLFFTGCYAGYMLAMKKDILHPRILTIGSICALVIELYLASKYDYDSMHRLGLYYLPQIIIVPGMCLLLSQLLDKISTKVLYPFDILGTMTLEIYLVHMSLRFIYPNSKFLIPIFVAIILHIFMKHVTKCLTR